MPTLTEKQAKYAKETVKRVVEDLMKDDVSVVICYFCEGEKDFKEEPGGFFPVAPLMDPKNLEKGLVLDDIKVVWVCVPCMERRGI